MNGILTLSDFRKMLRLLKKSEAKGELLKARRISELTGLSMKLQT